MKSLKLNSILIFIIFFVIAISVFFHKSIFTGEVLIPAHFLKICYPWRTGEEIQEIHNWENLDAIFNAYPFSLYVSRSVKEKIIPKWNPYVFCGIPFLANPGRGFFAPFNILDFFVNPAHSFTVKIIVSIFFSCLFMAILVWKLTKNRIASLLSGLIYGFNGISMLTMYAPTNLGLILWLPCLFLFLIQDAERHSCLYGIIAGLIISVQILNGVGGGNLLFYTIVAILAFGLYFSIIKKREERGFHFFGSPLCTVIFSIVLAVLLSAVQLLPSIEFVKYCQRGEVAFSLAPLYRLPATLIISLFPNFFGDITQTSWWGYYLYRYLFNVSLTSRYIFAYAGVLPVFLVLLVIGRKTHNKYYNFFGWLTIATFSFSHFYPLFTPILRFVPVLNKLRIHERAIWIYIFSLSVLAGLGLSSLTKRDISFLRLRRIRKGLVVILITAIILGGIVTTVLKVAGEKMAAIGKGYVSEHYGGNRFSTRYNYPVSYYNQLVEDIISSIKNSFSFKSLSYWRSIVCFLAVLGIFIIYSKGKNKVKLGWLCIIVLLFDLFSYGLNKTTWVKPETVYPSTPAIELLQKKSREDYSRIIGLWQQKLLKDKGEFFQTTCTSEILPSASSLIFKLYDARGYSALYSKDYYDFHKTFYPDMQDFTNFILFPDFNQRLFDLLSVRYILTLPGYDLSRNNLRLIYDKEVRIYENKNALPRVFLAPCIKNVKDREEVLKILSSPGFDPHNLALVMGYDNPPVFNPQSIMDSDVSIIDFQPNKIIIQAHMKGTGPLVLTDTYFPGWKAFIDGKETPIYRTNYIHRMIVVPKGEHLVEFIYDPLSFKIGAIISIAAFVGCSIVIAKSVFSPLLKT